jgi:hypothetical protein
LAEHGAPYISSFSIHGVVSDLEYAESRVFQVRTCNSFFRLKEIKSLVAENVVSFISAGPGFRVIRVTRGSRADFSRCSSRFARVGRAKSGPACLVRPVAKWEVWQPKTR